ncbi:MAG: alanine/ornithine racemase family PLP-dependent enzyme [Flavobacteriales bacterium]|nr:alanine/ornithine racemase family PLP-dependent enzyme [Flavobacteriales bacterium]
MAFIKLYKDKLKHNYLFLKKLFNKHEIEWGVVSKLFCGSPVFIKELHNLGFREMHDTRISNLKTIKSIDPEIQTVYIKPPAKRSRSSIIKYADVSFNTDLQTINWLSEEAVKQNKVHKIIIMVEMGDLREGVMGDQLMEFYEQVFYLPNIEIIGLGTNLNCLNGIMPNQDKLIQLCLYKQLIELKFKKTIKWISGGTSVTLSLLMKHQIPKGVNHFRIGEALFFANDLFTGEIFEGMQENVLKLFAEIIEVNEKPLVPSGEQIENVAGEIPVYPESDYGKTSVRAILDVGLLDINPKFITPDDEAIEIIEASSDMLVVNLKQNPKGYKTGDLVSFSLKYMGALGLMNSDYIGKVVE